MHRKEAQRMRNTIIRFITAMTMIIPLFAIQTASAAPSVSEHFDKVWAQADQSVADGSNPRSWTWGPHPHGARVEEYHESPGGQRTVQYYDKSRMEITFPDGDTNSTWYVTNGLLVKEMMSGYMQTGHEQFEYRGPAYVNVAGDLDRNGLHFRVLADFSTLEGDENCAVQDPGTTALNTWIINFQLVNKPAVANVYNGYYVEEACHNIANVFYDWMNDPASNIPGNGGWLYKIGLPLSEPYWTHTYVNGTNQHVLVQAFERRILTYTPGNSEVWQVEMGNVGQQYYLWRYGTPRNSDPSWSPDGKLAWTRNFINHDIMLWDGNAVTPVTSSLYDELLPEWQTSDTFTYYSSEGDSFLYNLTTGMRELNPYTDMITAPDGKKAYLDIQFVDQELVTSIHVTDNINDWIVAEDLNLVPQDLEWSPDSSMIAYSTTDRFEENIIERSVFVTSSEPEGFDPYVVYSGSGTFYPDDVVTPRGYDWAPDSEELAINTLDSICFYLVQTTEYSRCFDNIQVNEFDISSSGSVAYTDEHNHIWVFAYDDPNANVRMQLSSAPFNGSLEWSPDGSLLAFIREQAVWVVNIYQEETLIAHAPGF
jgi:Tol biopolymer transport system component